MINMAHHRDETADAEADEVKKQDRYPLLEGGTKERADEGAYNRFTILMFYEEDISASVFHHFTM